MRRDPWTSERIALLKSLWKTGATAQAIAERLGEGVSRSAVLGKISRLRRHAAKASIRALGRRTKQRARAQRSRAPIEHAKTLLELTNETCRWPHGRPGSAKFFFCGAPGADLEGGMPYCPAHAQRAYATPASSIEQPEARPEESPPRQLKAKQASSQRPDWPDAWRAVLRRPARGR